MTGSMAEQSRAALQPSPMISPRPRGSSAYCHGGCTIPGFALADSSRLGSRLQPRLAIGEPPKSFLLATAELPDFSFTTFALFCISRQ